MSDDSPHRRCDWQLRQLKGCNQRPFAPCPLHPARSLRIVPPASTPPRPSPSISQLVAVILPLVIFSCCTLLTAATRMRERREGGQWDKREKVGDRIERGRGWEASGGFAVTQSQGVNQRAGQSTITQMGLHADGAASPQGVKPHTLSACVCVCVRFHMC